MSKIEQEASEKSLKRRRTPGTAQDASLKRAKTKHAAKSQADAPLTISNIRRLGEEISESPKNYNGLVTLLKYARLGGKEADTALSALCHAFSMLIVDGRFTPAKGAAENELKVIQWLKTRREDFSQLLVERLGSSDTLQHRQALTLFMQMVKAELASESRKWADCWTGDRFFRRLVSSIAHGEASYEVAEVFAVEYVNKFDDVKYYTFTVLAQVLKPEQMSTSSPEDLDAVATLVEAFDPPQAESGFNEYLHDYSKEQRKSKKPPAKLADFQRQAQKAFTKVFSCPLSPGQRKALLNIISPVVVPWLQTPAHVLDFLTDSFDAGGSISLLALSGLYEMMTKYNLDYPSFYSKLYALLDDNLLHSAHRSRFLRLMNEYLESSHLPAAMVASFVKRLSRLALHGPPAAIVATIPWVYNMLQTHPSCTFMIHREPRTDAERERITQEGANDPFNMSEPDPMETGAIDSCLWELVTLQNHFHPNVASLAKIISQEFRKQSYNLEDFLDHSYSSLIAGELGKEMKKPPVVEFEIPKQIFTSAEGNSTLANLMTDMLSQA